MFAADSRLGGRWKRPSHPRTTPALLAFLVAAREKAGIRQRALAEALDVPQSFVAKYEGGERRVDVIEFVTIARALGADPLRILRDFLAGKEASRKPRKL